MTKRPLRKKALPPGVRRKIRKAAYDFHVRAFGEEMARINFAPLAVRRRYLADMIDHAKAKGVSFHKSPTSPTP